MDVSSIIHLLEHYVMQMISLNSLLIRGLNAMISLCEVFAKKIDITFNRKRNICIKFGQKLFDCEDVYLNDKK